VAGQLQALLSRFQSTRQHSQAESIISAPADRPTASNPFGPSELTDREVEVLRLIAKGATNREIAEALVISEGTVKNHISNILVRLNVRDRTQAAIYARDHGLL
jgi:DNA-binding NarL/FixJ family response regulator